MLKLLQGADEGFIEIGNVVRGMVIDNLGKFLRLQLYHAYIAMIEPVPRTDFGSIANLDSTCESGDTYGYTDTDTLDDREKIHFCDLTWDKPVSFDTSTCDSQGERPTEMIDDITRIVVHEMTHYSTVGPASTLAEQIVDQTNDDGVAAYGIERAFGVLDEDQDNQPGKAETNADNYA